MYIIMTIINANIFASSPAQSYSLWNLVWLYKGQTVFNSCTIKHIFGFSGSYLTGRTGCFERAHRIFILSALQKWQDYAEDKPLKLKQTNHLSSSGTNKPSIWQRSFSIASAVPRHRVATPPQWGQSQGWAGPTGSSPRNTRPRRPAAACTGGAPPGTAALGRSSGGERGERCKQKKIKDVKDVWRL